MHYKEQLVREVVPKYFGQSKYNSFARQLNGWGFKRLRQAGNDYDAYYHERFLRGMPSLVALMTREPSNQGKKAPYMGGEPNFYEIDKYYKLPTPAPVINSYEQYQLPPPARLTAPDVGNDEASISNETSGYNNSNPNDFSAFYSGGYYHPPPPQQPFYGYPHSSNMAAATGSPPGAHPPSYNYNNATNSNLASFSGYNPPPTHNSIMPSSQLGFAAYNPTPTNNTIMPASQSGYTPLFPPYNYWPQQQPPPEQVYSNYTHYRQYDANDDDNNCQPDNTSGPRKSEE